MSVRGLVVVGVGICIKLCEDALFYYHVRFTLLNQRTTCAIDRCEISHPVATCLPFFLILATNYHLIPIPEMVGRF